MAKKRLTVKELDELLVVLQDRDNYVLGPQDARLAATCVQLVRGTLVAPAPTANFDLVDDEEDLF